MNQEHDQYTEALKEQDCLVCSYVEKCKKQDGEGCESFAPISFGDWVNRLTDDG